MIQLQQIFSPIPYVTGQGSICQSVLNLMETLIKEDSPFDSTESTPTISHMICMDRNVDMISLFLSQLNYEGLLDEEFGISSGKL